MLADAISRLLFPPAPRIEVPAAKSTIIFDCEVAPNFFGLGLKRIEDGRRVWFERSRRAEFDPAQVRRIFKRNLMVGFNSLNYDILIIWLALTGASTELLQEASNRIIVGGLRRWEFEREFDVVLPDIDHIDLFEPNPSVGSGLKILNGRLHGRKMQDLPFEPNTELTVEQMEEAKHYCLQNDLDATHLLLEANRENIDLRIGIGAQYGLDLRSKSDAQMGEAIIKQQVEESTGRRVQKAEFRPGSSFRYQVPDWMRFETPMMQQVLATIAKTDIVVSKTGGAEFPAAFEEFDITIGESSYKLGLGGLHSQESTRAVRSDEQYVLLDADVASQYPSIIMKLGLFPKALGREFLKVYATLLKRRLDAKLSGDKVVNQGLKISINGAYGKLGSKYSVLYAPHLMIAVTLTGQLSLLMLIERLEAIGVRVVSGNTDGIVFKCPRELFNGFVMKDGKPTVRLMPSAVQDIIDWWESTTSFALEFAEYEAVYSRDVNCYMAIKPGGKAKRKGTIANHWSKESPDYDPREQMKKNVQMTVCNDAALAHILHGTSIEKFIREYTDIRGFLTVVQVGGGGTWRGDYLGKAVRFCWVRDGAPIMYKNADARTGNHKKVSKSDDCLPLMELPDELPADLDYDRYVAEAKQILIDIAFRPPLIAAPKIARGRRSFNSPIEWLGKTVLAA